jgi:hypothetical protein
VERVTVDSKHIANRHLAAPALPGPGIRVDPRCDDPWTVIGSHPEQRPGRGRGRSLPCHNGPTPALRRLAAITPPRHGGVAFR